MNSIESKFHSSKNVTQAKLNSSLRIRTNKHRIFVFCIGQTSLTCVPGIGKKNKHLLNKSGVHDLSVLYAKYHTINSNQKFKKWLQNDIGFTSYQAKMTTCGIRSKLGEIKEVDTGLVPIHCLSKEKRTRKHTLLLDDRSIDKENRTIERIKSENSLARSYRNQLRKVILIIVFQLIFVFSRNRTKRF